MTGFFYKVGGVSIDICNQMIAESTPTIKQVGGSNYFSGFKSKNGVTIYDLAELYKINSASITSNTALGMYGQYLSSKTDIGFVFTTNNPLLTNMTVSPSSSKLYYYSTSNSLTIPISFNALCSIIVLCIGGGGNGGKASATINPSGGCGGGGATAVFTNIIGNFNIVIGNRNAPNTGQSTNGGSVSLTYGGSTLIGATGGQGGYTEETNPAFGLNGGTGTVAATNTIGPTLKFGVSGIATVKGGYGTYDFYYGQRGFSINGTSTVAPVSYPASNSANRYNSSAGNMVIDTALRTAISSNYTSSKGYFQLGFSAGGADSGGFGTATTNGYGQAGYINTTGFAVSGLGIYYSSDPGNIRTNCLNNALSTVTPAYGLGCGGGAVPAGYSGGVGGDPIIYIYTV